MIAQRPPLPIVPGARRVAVLRANALGDLVFCLPALHSLRAAYPDSEIVLLGGQVHTALLTGRPSPVDRVEVVPPVPGLVEGEFDNAREEEFVRRMRAERFDLALQMHGGGRTSNPFVLGLQARVTVGMRTPDAPALDRWMPYVYFQPEVMRYLELVSLAGAAAITYQPALSVTARDRAAAAEVLTDRRYAVVHPGATDIRRRWPAAGFAEVADRLANSGLRVVLSGTGAERETVDEVAERMRARPVTAVDRLSLGGLAGLLASASVVVSNDTGPLHLADAVGARTVGIYWCGNLVNGAPFNRIRHRPVASWRGQCPVCGTDCIRDSCDHSVSFVADVGVDEVAEAALDLLEADWLAA